MKILVLAAHADDETLGCGGTIARLADEGQEIYVLVLADGESSRGMPGDEMQRRIGARLVQMSKACNDLGVFVHSTCELPDNALDTVPMLEIAQHIEAVVQRWQPEIVFTHSAADLNQDHVAAHRATLIATRPQLGCTVREVYAYEVPSSTEWNFGASFRPNVWWNVSQTLGRKLQAMKCYEGECREWPHPRSERALRARAAHWGSVVGADAAEAFEVVRIVR